MSEDKVKATLLAAFKRANKVRRLAMAKKYGFDSVEEFEKYLTGKSVEKVEKVKETPKVTSENPPVDAVIAFDTTGSMSSYIANVRKHAKQVVQDMFKNIPNLRMKIVAFGDYCDMTGVNVFGEAYQEIELTEDSNSLINFIDKARDTGGGDTDEFYELVIRKINTETKWREGSKRTVLFIADDGPHPLGYTYDSFVKNNQIDWRNEAKEAAKLGIMYDTLRIHAGSKWYQELSEITGGVSLPFKNSEKISQVMEATAYARSSKTMFKSMATKAYASGDKELIGVYKKLGEIKD